MTIIERALEMVTDGSRIGLGSGRAAQAFVRALGERVRTGQLACPWCANLGGDRKAWPWSKAFRSLTLAEAGILDLTVDGADEVDPNLDLIKGYGRALVREKIVAASSRRLIILVGDEKLVPQLGTRGKLPVEVMPFALPSVRATAGRTWLPAGPRPSGRKPVCDRQRQSHSRLPDRPDCGCGPAGKWTSARFPASWAPGCSWEWRTPSWLEIGTISG